MSGKIGTRGASLNGNEILRVPAVFMRGGTSRGVFFRQGDLPDDPSKRDRLLLRVLGSPDKYRRQIDGMGGASSSTSKAAIISPSSHPECDVDYLIAQVSIDEPIVDYSSNCGNLASAVGPFAIRKGMIAAAQGTTTIRIWQVNTQRRIVAHVPTRDGEPVEEGDFVIDGVSNAGAEVSLDFLDPTGTSTGFLLPTGNATDDLEVPGAGRLTVSMVDAAQAIVFVRASDLGLAGTELKPEIDGNPEILATLEAIRTQAAIRMGLVSDGTISPATPKVAFVAAPKAYSASDGRLIGPDEVDFVARIMSMGALHHAYEVTGAIATAAAAAIPGTVVNEVAGFSYVPSREVRIGHVSGVISVGAELKRLDDVWTMPKASLGRTSRRLMEGDVFVPTSCLLAS